MNYPCHFDKTSPTFRVLCPLLIALLASCGDSAPKSKVPGGADNSAVLVSTDAAPVPLCQALAQSPNQLACLRIPGGCNNPALTCRAQSGLCMPNEDNPSVTPCKWDAEGETEACASGHICAEGLCIPSTPAWTAPRRCQQDEDCWSYSQNGEPGADGTWCNLAAGGYCIAECLPGTTCENGSVCSCDGRCSPAEEKIAIFAPTLEAPASVIAFGQDPDAEEYSARAVEITVTVDNRAFGSKLTRIEPDRGLLAMASPGLRVAINGDGSDNCVMSSSQLTDAKFGKECVVPVAVEKRNGLRSGITTAVWVRPDKRLVIAAMQLSVSSPWASPREVSVSVNIMGAKAGAGPSGFPPDVADPIPGEYEGEILITPEVYSTENGSRFSNLSAMRVPVTVQVGPKSQGSCDGPVCTQEIPMLATSPTKVLGEPQPLGLRILFTRGPRGENSTLLLARGNVWTEATLARVLQQGTYEDDQVALPIRFDAGTEQASRWLVHTGGRAIRGTVTAHLQPYLATLPSSGIYTRDFALRMDLSVVRKRDLAVYPTLTDRLEYDKQALQSRSYNALDRLAVLAQGNNADPFAQCLTPEGRAQVASQRVFSNSDVGFECAQRFLCDGTAAPDGIGRFDSTTLVRSGELRCASGLPGWDALPLLVGVGDGRDNSGVGALLQNCFDEVQEPFHAQLKILASASYNSSDARRIIHSLFDKANNDTKSKCVDVARFYAALSTIVAEYGAGSNLADATGTASMEYYLANLSGRDDGRSKRLLYRLVGLWIKTHSFMARETLAEASLSGVLERSATNEINPGPGIEEMLEVMEKSWSLLLHPAMQRPLAPYRTLALTPTPQAAGGRIAVLYPEYLRQPDYRVGLTKLPARVPEHHDQTVGLPVFMIEGLTAHAELLEKYLSRAAEEEYESCKSSRLTSSQQDALERYGTTMRYALAVEQFARDLHGVAELEPASTLPGSAVLRDPQGVSYRDETGAEISIITRQGIGTRKTRALAPGAPPSWESRWKRALDDYQRARDKVTGAALSIAACRNPFNIAENDTPLFFGDPAGDSNRYFAASDYLLNTWALPAVHAASTTLKEARQAWAAERSYAVQNTQNEFEFAHRIEQLKEKYGRSISDICGLQTAVEDVLEQFADVPESLPATSEAAAQQEPDLGAEYQRMLVLLREGTNPAKVPARPEDQALYPYNCYVSRSPACGSVLAQMAVGSAARVVSLQDKKCQPYKQYAHLSKRDVQRDVCMLAYSVPAGLREDLASDPSSAAVVLNAIYQRFPLSLDRNFSSNGSGNVFGTLSDEAVRLLARQPNPGLDSIEMDDCNKGFEVLGKNVPMQMFYDVAAGVLAAPWLMMLDYRYRLDATYNTIEPDAKGTVFQSMEANAPVPKSFEQAFVPFHGLMQAYTLEYCHRLPPGAEQAVDFFGMRIYCSHGLDVHGRWNGAPIKMVNFRQPEIAAAETVEDFFPRVNLYCEAYADHRYHQEQDALQAKVVLENSGDAAKLAECLHGQIGSSEIDVLSARQGVEAAVLSLETLNKSIDLIAKRCEKSAGTAESIAEIQAASAEAHAATLELIQKTREANQGSWWESALTGAANGAVSGAMSGQVWAAAAGGLVGGITSGFSSYRAQSTQKAISKVEVEAAREEATRQKLITVLANSNANDECLLQVNLQKTQIDGQKKAIQHNLLMVASALQRRAELERLLVNLIRDGKDAVTREMTRKVPSLPNHFWASEQVERFGREMQWAKRLTYLAAKAVEYEFQQTLYVRSKILQARHPDELASAIEELQREQAGRTINRNRPSEHSVVLSLRELVAGPSFSSEQAQREKLRKLLISPESAYYNSAGEYLGQAIPFHFLPTGSLTHRCGERVWSVGATVQGDMLGTSEPSVPLFLLKGNTFKSQWCSPHASGDGVNADSDHYQYGYIYPTAHLFNPSQGGVADSPGDDTFTWAMMGATENTPATQFYADAFREGSSEEIAGRGLYGDYLLLFPWKGVLEKGFTLDRVEDVWLRFDVLSVAKSGDGIVVH